MIGGSIVEWSGCGDEGVGLSETGVVDRFGDFGRSGFVEEDVGGWGESLHEDDAAAAAASTSYSSSIISSSKSSSSSSKSSSSRSSSS